MIIGEGNNNTDRWMSFEESQLRHFMRKMAEFRMGIAFPLNTRLPNYEEIKDYAERIGKELGISEEKISEYVRDTALTGRGL